MFFPETPGLLFFNAIYTAAAVVFFSIFDEDLPSFYPLRYPILYRSGPAGGEFSPKIFWGKAFGIGTYHAVIIIIFFINNLSYSFRAFQELSFQDVSCATLSVVIVVCQLQLLVEVGTSTTFSKTYFYIQVFLCVFFGLAFWIAMITCYSYILASPFTESGIVGMYYLTVERIFSLKDPKFYWTAPIALVACLIPDLFYKGYKRRFSQIFLRLQRKLLRILIELGKCMTRLPGQIRRDWDRAIGQNPRISIVERTPECGRNKNRGSEK